GSRTTQESHPTVGELPTSEILFHPTSTSIIRVVKEEIEVARSEDWPTIRPDLTSTCRLPKLDPTPDEDLGHTAAEDVGEDMVVVPDVPLTTAEVKIEDIQLDPTSNTPEEVNRLQDGIWRIKHLFIGKGNELPPVVRGLVCGIDVGGTKPIAQKVRSPSPTHTNSGRSCRI
ncbi:hypothetical protein JG687_00013564, partial [Phytophthora cactorum]